MTASMLDILDERFAAAARLDALAVDDTIYTYESLAHSIDKWMARIKLSGLKPGTVVLLQADFTSDGVGALFAAMRSQLISILLSPSSYAKQEEFCEIGRAQARIDTFSGTISTLEFDGAHPLYDRLRASSEPGIVLFSSGSTGKSKGTVHSGQRLLEKFRKPGKEFRTIAFLLFDHIAGLDTLFYALANSSLLVLPSHRTPDAVCRLIERYKVEVLPTSPSFINLLLLSGAAERHDLSSLKIITYGSEAMSQSTLDQCAVAFPNVRLLQKFGTSETGALPTRSKSNTSTWLKIGGEGFEWRERDGLLEIRAKTAMLGYLNAPSPFTEDNFFMTGDRIEVDGDFVRILGRDNDVINVGGQKVFPAEVENVIRTVPGIEEVAVSGEPHILLGTIVVARIKPVDKNVSPVELRKQIRAHLSGTLESYKIPQKFVFTQQSLTTERFKIARKVSS